MADPLSMAQAGFDPYAGYTDAGWFGSNIAKGISKVAKKVAKVAVKAAPIVAQKLAPIAQTALRNSGPMGMVANAAVEGMKAGLSGKNIGGIALAAAHGAAPSGINEALVAGEKLARGDNVIKTALATGADHFIKGSGERFAYSVAADALKKGATKSDLGIARKALATEGQRRAFDAAVGTVALAMKKPPRPMSANAPTVAPRVQMARKSMRVELKSHAVAKRRKPRWQRLSNRGAAWLRRHVPHAPVFALLGRDTGALSGGLTASQMPTVRLGNVNAAVKTLQATLNEKRGAALVVDGNFGPKTLAAVKAFQLASGGLVVDGVVGPKTWAALDAAASMAVPASLPMPAVITSRPTLRLGSRDPAVKTAQVLLNTKNNAGLVVDGIFGQKTQSATMAFQKRVGLVVDGVIGPKTWAALDSAPGLMMSTPAISLPTIVPTSLTPQPTITDSASDTASAIQAKAILVAWTKTDGIGEAGFPDYGVRPEDMSTTFGPRDVFVAASFERWSNRTQGTNLPTDGGLTPELSNALRVWAEKRAAAAANFPTVAPAPSQSPGIVPSTAIVPVSPSLPTVVQTPTGPVVSLPQDTVVAKSPAVVVNQPKPADKPNALVLAGGGAALGFAIAGLPGAIIGGAAGAIASA